MTYDRFSLQDAKEKLERSSGMRTVIVSAVIACLSQAGCTLGAIPPAPADTGARDAPAGTDASVDARVDVPPPFDCTAPKVTPDASATCAAITSCAGCVQVECGWCGAEGRCIASNLDSTPAECCSGGWTRSRNECPHPGGGTWEEHCASFSNCLECNRETIEAGNGCGWCGENSRCYYGDSNHSIGHGCFLSNNWTFGARNCL